MGCKASQKGKQEQSKKYLAKKLNVPNLVKIIQIVHRLDKEYLGYKI